MITPIELIKATVDGMIARRFGRILNITSSAVKAPIAELALSNGARSGLTGFVAGLARATVAHNVTINNLLPGRFWTDRLKSNTEFTAKEKGKTVEEVRRDIEKAIPAGRFGTPEEFGELCAYLCSVQAGYITGQNFLIVGYVYSHAYVRLRIPARRHIHIALLALAAATLPLAAGAAWKPAGGEDPTWRILGLLATSVGLPYFALSTTGPLVQAWYARSREGAAPYRLFALSNLGSMLALVSYPLAA